MADYSPDAFIDNSGPPYVGQTALNKIGNGIADAASHHKVGTFAAMPAASAANKNWLYFTSDTGGVYLSDGTQWILVAGSEPARKVGAAGQPAFAGTWVNSPSGIARQPLHFWKSGAVVHIRGAVTGGGATTVFTLPVGYRPVNMAEDILGYWNGSAVVSGYSRVLADGSVQVFNSAESGVAGISEAYLEMDFRVDV